MKVRHQSLRPSRSGTDLTRRGLMRGGLGFAAAATFGRDAEAAGEAVSPVMQRLSAYMSEAKSRAIPDAVVQETKYHILDTPAATTCESQLPPGRHASPFAHASAGDSVP